MNFAQALARIEVLTSQLQDIKHVPYWTEVQRELEYLTVFHADSIVQLGRVAEVLRYAREGSASEQEACTIYDKLMKGDGGCWVEVKK